MIASPQGNHGYFSYIVINKKKQKQDKMKLENITVVFHSIMHYNSFDHPFYVTQHYRESILQNTPKIGHYICIVISERDPSSNFRWAFL